jgi:hypothetical protein
MVGCQSLSDQPCKARGSSVTSAGHGAIPCQAGEAMASQVCLLQRQRLKRTIEDVRITVTS